MTDLCRIPKGARVVYGSGGSTAMIVLTPDNRALKYFPLLSSDIAIPAKERGRYFAHITNEIKILGTLTKQFIDKKRTPHLVGLIGAHYCPEIPHELFASCIPFVKVISTKATNKAPCTFLHPNTIINNGLHIAEVEYCNSSLGAELQETVHQYCNSGDFSILGNVPRSSIISGRFYTENYIQNIPLLYS